MTNIVKLNVGGIKYETLRSTLLQYNSVLSKMLNEQLQCNILDDNGYIFIDRNGRLFETILDWHRTKYCPFERFSICELNQLYDECVYYNVPLKDELIEYLETSCRYCISDVTLHDKSIRSIIRLRKKIKKGMRFVTLTESDEKKGTKTCRTFEYYQDKLVTLLNHLSRMLDDSLNFLYDEEKECLYFSDNIKLSRKSLKKIVCYKKSKLNTLDIGKEIKEYIKALDNNSVDKLYINDDKTDNKENDKN